MAHDGIGNPDAFDLQGADKYTGFRQSSTFDYDPGVFVVALASRTPKTATIRVHGGMGVRRVKVAAARRGSPPILPAAVNTDRDTLVACSVHVPLPVFSPDSPTFDWTVEGSYLYVTTHEDGPRVPGKDFLPAGQYPFPLPMQDAAVESLAAGGDGPEQVAQTLSMSLSNGSVFWPFTTYPPQMFNSILLRDTDDEYTAELRGDPNGPGLGD